MVNTRATYAAPHQRSAFSEHCWWVVEHETLLYFVIRYCPITMYCSLLCACPLQCFACEIGIQISWKVVCSCNVWHRPYSGTLNHWVLNIEPFLTWFVTTSQLTLPMYTLTLQRDSIQVGGNAGMLSIGEMPSGVSEDSLTWVSILMYPYYLLLRFAEWGMWCSFW